MKSFRDRNPYAVGLVSVLVIGAITGMAFLVGLNHLLEHAYDVRAEFADSGGIRAGDDVKVAGVKIGRVTAVEVDRAHGRVVVKFKVNNNVEVRDDATAEIALESLLGGAYIRIVNASAGDELLSDMPRADRLIEYDPLTSKTPYSVFQLTRVATRGIEKLDTEALNDVITSAADITQGKRETITRLITAVDKVGRAVNSRDAELRDLLDKADTLTATLAEKDDTLVQLIDVSQKVLDVLIQRRDQLSEALGSGADVVEELSRLIRVHKTELDSILTTLHPTLDAVARQQGNIDVGLAWVGPGLLQQSRSGGHGPWLDVFIRGAGPDVIQSLADLYGQLLGSAAAASSPAAQGAPG